MKLTLSSYTSEPGIVVLQLSGEVNDATAPQVRQAVREALDQTAHLLIVDLSAVRYLSSAGRSALLLAFQGLRERDGTLCLVAPQRAVLRALTISGLSRLFTIAPTLEAALRS